MAIVITVVCVLVGAIALWLVAAFCYRYYVVRRGSTSVILRRLPAADGAGWRHGVIVYGDSGVRYFRLSSLRMFADLHFRRSRLELGGKRTPVGTELEIMSRSMPIVAVDGDGLHVEIALERESMTAFQSWVESRPPERSLRRAPPPPP
ncbi:DUF2550 domain-containing protein [Tomitella gaofuii]|uniref:DUF2550 domain-containing protein n=1 Tax=Tomitella gaofuii TaxID=2760083 RepID=UPI0020C0F810|nr:DUF2550 domain-containing protein [Tomitella gaofuii]